MKGGVQALTLKHYEMPPVTVTHKDLKPLKTAYQKAVKEKKDFFLYKGQEVVTTYAKYLIEYLELKT